MDSCGWSISRESKVLGQIGEQFNKPNLSDVTLQVGEQSYFVHRFLLAAQSSVFQSMLTDPNWKESNEKVIQLQESQEGGEAFCDFLKFFYTGKLTLFSSNVCGIHMLADKYDVPLVKRDAETFMKGVLKGEREGTLPSSLKWLAYIEQFIPDLLPTCYEAIQTNFEGLRLMEGHDFADELAPRHFKEILTCPSNDKDIAVFSEIGLYDIFEKWAKSKFTNLSSKKTKSELSAILPLIRFHNMKGAELQKVEESELGKAMGTSFVSECIIPAYKVHSQRLTIVEDVSKTSGAGVECKCPCQLTNVCPHLNPRFYFGINPVFSVGKFFKTSQSQCIVKPWDLGTLETCLKVYTEKKVYNSLGCWTIDWTGNYQSHYDHINETFSIKPAASDIGRKFTIVIVISPKGTLDRYAIKCTAVVHKSKRHAFAEPIEVHSPLRPESSWKITDNDIWVGVVIHLHKP